MSSPIAGLAYDIFKPELWSALLNFSLKKKHVGGNFINRNYEGEIRAMGDVVHVQEPGAVSSSAYTAYSDISFATPTGTDRTLTIDQADYVAFNVDDIDKVQSKPELMQAHTVEAVYGLAQTQDVFIFQQYTQAASGVASDHANPLSLTAHNIYARCVDAARVLDLQSVPSEGRRVAFSPGEVALLRQAPQFVPISATASQAAFAGGGTADSAGVVRTGQVGAVAGFEVYETNNLTTISGVRKALFATQQATTFAQQITQMKAVDLEKRFAMGVKGLNVYGRATFRAEALAVLHITP